MFTGFYDPSKDPNFKPSCEITTMSFDLPVCNDSAANDQPTEQEKPQDAATFTIPDSPSSLSFGAYLSSVTIKAPTIASTQQPSQISPTFSPSNYSPSYSHEPGSFGASFYKPSLNTSPTSTPSTSNPTTTTEPKKDPAQIPLFGFAFGSIDKKPATENHAPAVHMNQAATAHDEKKDPAEIPFNLQRSNFNNIFGYIEPAKQPEQVSPNTPTGPIRISMLESGFTHNPYYHHDEYDPENNKEPETPEAKKIGEIAAKERERIDTHVFEFFSQPNNDFSNFVGLLGKVSITGEKYVDKDFPANQNSLIGDNYDRISEWGDAVWLRADDFYGKGNYQVFMDKIEPNDIEQGLLGNCYFLSTLSSLAEWPDRIRRLFATKERNEAGCYCVKVCEMGEWKEVVIDDFFPCNRYKKTPIFTKGNDKELWVLILEKVWAKIYGSYDSTEAGLTRECLHDLTGAPTMFFFTDRKEEWGLIWKKLLKAESRQYVMTCGAGEFWTSTGVNEKGIVASHAYSLLAAYDEVDAYGRPVKLVKLRNPWGQTEWNGPWSDSSSNWTPELKKRLHIENKNDGVFFMAYEDFLKYFDDIQVCYVHDSFQYTSKRVTSDANHAKYFKVKIEKEGKYYFTVNQESKRKHAQNSNYRYSSVNLVIAKIQGNGQYQYATGNSRADKEVWAKAKLTPGEYLVYAKVKWLFQNQNDFTLSTYGPGMTNIQEVSKKEHVNMLDQVFMGKAKNSQKKQTYAREGEVNCYSVVDICKDGFIYCYYNNQSSRTLETEIYFKEFRGVKLRKPFRGQAYSLKVPPGQERIVLLKILPNQDVRQVFGEKVRFT